MQVVKLVEMLGVLAEGANAIQKAALDEMLELKTKAYTDTKVVEILDGGVKARRKDGLEETIPCDAVLYAVGVKANRDTVEALRASDAYSMFFSVGDSEWGSPFTAKCIRDAVHGGYFAAMDVI